MSVCRELKITDIKVLDKSLPSGTMISSSNVKSGSGQHVVVKFEGCKELKHKEGKSLMIYDQLEVPDTNVLQVSIQKKHKIDYITNQVSVLFALIGR